MEENKGGSTVSFEHFWRLRGIVMDINEKKSGFTLIELVIAVGIVAIAGLAVVKGLQMVSALSVRSNQEIRSQRLFREFKTQIDSLPFELVFPIDSSQPYWGLGSHHATYLGNGAMNDLLAHCRREGFSKFTIEVTYMRRDTSNVSGKGTGALIPFTDVNHDNIDDYDPNIRFADIWSVPRGTWTFVDVNNNNVDDVNGISLASINHTDGDFFDSCLYKGGMSTDVPNTNLRQVKISLFANSNPAKPFAVQEYLISKEKLSGNAGYSDERDLKIEVTIPAQPRVLYQRLTGSQDSAQSLVLTTGYPDPAYRADSSNFLVVEGFTAPNATVYISTSTPPSGAGSTIRDTLTADSAGHFSGGVAHTTSGLIEGVNVIYYEAVKTVTFLSTPIQMRSPVGLFRAIWDIKRPSISSEGPTSSHVHTLSPVVGAVFLDNSVTIGATTSGICPSVITLKVDPQGSPPEVAYSPPHVFFNMATGEIRWWDPTTHLPLQLENGRRYDIKLEGGDRAHYGRTSDWDFRIDIDESDASPPVLDNLSPLDGSVNVLNPVPIHCKVWDGDSGVDYSSVELFVNGVPVINSSLTPLMGDFIDARNGTLTVPPQACPSGSTIVIRVRARHWGVAADPAQNWLDDNSWNFTCAP